jgi:AAA+ superfamily predicted ATPase
MSTVIKTSEGMSSIESPSESEEECPKAEDHRFGSSYDLADTEFPVKQVKLEIERILEPNKDFKISKKVIDEFPYTGWNYLPEEFKDKKNLIMIPTDIVDDEFLRTFMLSHKKLYGIYSQVLFKSNHKVGYYYAGHSIFIEPSFYYIEPGMYLLNAPQCTDSRTISYTYIIFDGVSQKEMVEKILRFVKNYRDYVIKINERNEFNFQMFDRVFLKDGIKEDIISDLSGFLQSEDQYEELGIPWKRGYLFSGPPGNGKTLLLRQIGKAFDIELKNLMDYIDKRGKLIVPLAKVRTTLPLYGYLDIHRLAFYGSKNSNLSIYFIEDLEKVVGRNDNDFAEITLSNFLNAIDGVDALGNGFILIATTNYMNDLAGAVVGRPGRFDRIFEFKNPIMEQIREFFEFYNFKVKSGKNDKTEEIMKELEGYSMAFVEEFIKASKMKVRSNIIKYKDARTILDKIHKHGQAFKEYSEKIGFNC